MRQADGSRHPSWSNAEGFTLLELLVAMSLLTIIVVMILGGLRFGRRAWDVADRVDQTASTSAAQLLLRDLLSRAEPLGIPDDQGRLQLAFQGTQDHLVLVVNLEGHTTTGGMHEIDIGYRPNTEASQTGQGAVRVALRPFRPAVQATQSASATENRELVEKATGLQFRYFGRPNADDKPDWHKDWQRATRLPDLIGLTVLFAPNDSRAWQEVLVAPMMR
jgi:general secretion pathway protein J